MDQSLEDLRQALRKLREEIESQVRSEPAGPAESPVKHAGRAPVGGPRAAEGVQAVQEAPGEKPPADLPEPVLAEAEDDDLPSEVFRPLPVKAASPRPSSPESGRGSRARWAKGLLAAGLAAAAAGLFLGSGTGAGAGLLVCLAGVLAGVPAAPSAPANDEDEVRELALRVAALERRTSAVSRASETGSLPREIIEEVVELRRILTSLFKALEKPPGKP